MASVQELYICNAHEHNSRYPRKYYSAALGEALQSLTSLTKLHLHLTCEDAGDEMGYFTEHEPDLARLDDSLATLPSLR